MLRLRRMLRAGVLGGGGVDPLVMWFRADDGTFQDAAGTIPSSAGDPVRLWRSMVGPAALSAPDDASRPTAEANAINGEPAVLFDGVSHWMACGNPFALPSPYDSPVYTTKFPVTIFCVAQNRAESITADKAIFGCHLKVEKTGTSIYTHSRYLTYLDDPADVYIFYNQMSNDGVYSTAVPVDQNTYIHRHVINANMSLVGTIWDVSSELASGTRNSAASFHDPRGVSSLIVGSTRCNMASALGNIRISELRMYTGELSDDLTTAVLAELRERYYP